MARATRIVRDSKYRHVFGEELTKERYEDLQPSSKSTESLGIRVNEKYLAIAWESGGGSTLDVIPREKIGRLPAQQNLISGHKGAILDFEWNPFDDQMLISASEDQTLKLWQVPEGGLKEHLKEPLATLEGHGKKITLVTFNRAASHIVASVAFDMQCKVWNLAEQSVAYSIDLPDQVWSLRWNYTGSLLACGSKDKSMRIIDPRQSKIVSEGKVHEGSKAIKVEWMGRPGSDESNLILTTGFSTQAERQIALWDVRKFGADAEPLNMMVLDQGTGSLFPFYDPGTNLAFFAGKGDGNVRYFELTPEADPFIHFITQVGSSTPQKGFDFLPKRCCDVSKHEIMRGFKLESRAVLPISFKVPRKSEAFQEDIFPDCFAPVPAMSPDEWSAGKAKEPLTQSMAPGAEGLERKKAASIAIVSVSDLKKQLAEAQAKIAELEAENAKLKEQLAAKS